MLEEVKTQELEEAILLVSALALVCRDRVQEKGRHQNRASLRCEPDRWRRESGSKPLSRLMHTSEIMEIKVLEHKLPFARSAQILCFS